MTFIINQCTRDLVIKQLKFSTPEEIAKEYMLSLEVVQAISGGDYFIHKGD